MKKLLLLSFLLYSFYNLFGQDVLKYNAYSLVFFDMKTRKWENKSEPVDILISVNFEDRKIKIYSKSTQIYDIIQTYDEERIEDGKKFRFYCEDRNGSNCYIDFVYYDDGTKQLYVRYSDIQYLYNIQFSQ